MKKYVVPIASRDIDLSRIKFSEPLSCEIDNNKINITYKKHLDSNTYKTVKNTGIAVISDCGEFNEIHPKNKVPVGERLCLQAEKLFYGMDVKAFGPIYKSLEYKNGGIELSFDHAENGFVVKGEAQGFEIAGKDEEFVKADITINGSKIFIKSDAVEKPLYARYNWFNYCEVTIFNETGIPLAPFRTEK